MTKQEEIQSWLADYLCGKFLCNENPHYDGKEDADFILSHLHSQGVVLKGRSLGSSPPYFAVESLIKEGFMHNHNCKHENVKYCQQCLRARCLDCDKEWVDACTLQHFLPTTVPIPSVWTDIDRITPPSITWTTTTDAPHCTTSSVDWRHTREHKCH